MYMTVQIDDARVIVYEFPGLPAKFRTRKFFMSIKGCSIGMIKGKWRTALEYLALASMVLLACGEVKISLGATELTPYPKPEQGRHVSRIQGIYERLHSAPEPSTTDSMLNRTREWKWNRYLKSMLNLPDWIDLGLENRTRLEVYDHPWRTTQTLGQTDAQVPQRSRVRVGLDGGPFRFLFEGQDSRTHLTGPDSFGGTGVVNEMDILQLFVSATGTNLLGTGLRTDIHFGRMTMDFGKRRLIARNDFRNTTNAFDGLYWQVVSDNKWRVRTFLVEPVIRFQRQLDEQSARSVFWGTFIENDQVEWLRLNVYYYGLNDQTSSTVGTKRKFSTFGIRLYEDPQKGRMDYEIESAWQTGKRGNTDHFAYFQHLTVGYSFHLPWDPQFIVYYDYASGDRNANDSQDSAFDTLYGARRFELMPTGIFGPFYRSNISSPGWRIIVKPVKGWKFQIKHRIWYLATSRGVFAQSANSSNTSNALQDPTGGSGNFLGHDLELRGQWKINDNLEFDAGYDHWFKGSYFDRYPSTAGKPLPPGGNKDTDYFYILTKVRI